MKRYLFLLQYLARWNNDDINDNIYSSLVQVFSPLRFTTVTVPPPPEGTNYLLNWYMRFINWLTTELNPSEFRIKALGILCHMIDSQVILLQTRWSRETLISWLHQIHEHVFEPYLRRYHDRRHQHEEEVSDDSYEEDFDDDWDDDVKGYYAIKLYRNIVNILYWMNEGQDYDQMIEAKNQILELSDVRQQLVQPWMSSIISNEQHAEFTEYIEINHLSTG